MPSFSNTSQSRLNSCDNRIIAWATALVRIYDCTVIEGYRGMARQNAAYDAGHSKIRYPNSKHNAVPSLAVDIAPWVPGRGIPWPQVGSDTYIKDLAQWYHMAGYGEMLAHQMGIPLFWGGDWDRDHDLYDQTFDDLPHWELRDD